MIFAFKHNGDVSLENYCLYSVRGHGCPQSPVL